MAKQSYKVSVLEQSNALVQGFTKPPVQQTLYLVQASYS